MRALQLTKPSSDPPSLTLTTLPTPSPTPGHALVRITAAYINPSDLINTKGGFGLTTYPRVPGRDFAGVIESLEPSSSSSTTSRDDDPPPFQPGDRVFGTSGRVLSFTLDGSHASHTLVPLAALTRTPASLTDAQAAMVGVPYTTAALAVQTARVRAGESVLVLGATGAVGTAACQYAAALGARVIRAARHERSAEGVDLLADPGLEKVRELTGGKGVDMVVNTVGDVALQKSALGVLAPYGRLSFISAPRSGSTEFAFELTSFYRKQLSLLGNNSLLMSLEEAAQSLRELVPLFEQGKLQVEGEDKLTKISLEQAVDAYADLAKGSRNKYMIINQ
ncbi:MAG: hypothetical protein M1822_004568 [Bathelium mastoideum]|nr:MAG: hypothetical protein M1822_004568 [Bathelium mastoideum]